MNTQRVLMSADLTQARELTQRLMSDGLQTEDDGLLYASTAIDGFMEILSADSIEQCKDIAHELRRTLAEHIAKRLDAPKVK